MTTLIVVAVLVWLSAGLFVSVVLGGAMAAADSTPRPYQRR